MCDYGASEMAQAWFYTGPGATSSEFHASKADTSSP